MLQLSKVFDSLHNWKEKAKHRADELRLARKKIKQQANRLLEQEKRIKELEKQLKKTP